MVIAYTKNSMVLIDRYRNYRHSFLLKTKRTHLADVSVYFKHRQVARSVDFVSRWMEPGTLAEMPLQDQMRLHVLQAELAEK